MRKPDRDGKQLCELRGKIIKQTSKVTALLVAFAVLMTSVFVLPAAEVSAAAGMNAAARTGNIAAARTSAVSIVKKAKARNISAGMTLIAKDGEAFDYRTEAGEQLYGYDTLQGACANGGFAYLTLYNRLVEKSKIVKVDIASREVVRVSAPLQIYHANNLTYNTKKNLILATCCKVKAKRAVFIDPENLTVTGKKDIKLSKKVKKLPGSVRRKYKGFTAIAYNAEKDCYVGRLKGNENAIIFDGDLKPVRYVKLKGKQSSLLVQGMDSKGGYIYDVRSFKGRKKYNMVTIHTMSGKLVSKVTIPYGSAPGDELQCIFHDGGQFYAGIYRTTSQKHDTRKYHVFRSNKLYILDNMPQ